MVYINPVNIIHLLMLSYNYDGKQITQNNPREIELHDVIKNLIDTSIQDTNYVVETIDALEFEDMDRPHVSEIAIEGEPASSYDLEDVEEEYEETCALEDGNITPDYKRKAVEYWTAPQSHRRSLSSVQKMFKKVTSTRQLYRWKKYVEKGGTNRGKWLEIAKHVLCKFSAAMDQNGIVHDVDLRQWALEANAIVQLEGFKASKSWITQFKKYNGITSRKITKFVGRTYGQEKEDLQTIATNFVNSVKPYIETCGAENVYNADESGFNLELHSGRTLTYKGAKAVACTVQSVGSTTHSYTILPIISAAGKLISPVLIVFKEAGGKFGPKVRENLFRVCIIKLTLCSIPIVQIIFCFY